MSLPNPAVAGVIGWPVAHSLSPVIHRFWLNKLDLDGDYSRFPVHPDYLPSAVNSLAALGLRGVNVTVPHKEKVMALVNHLAQSAIGVGAVNTIIRDEDGQLHGHNTDVDGIVDALGGHDLKGRDVCLIGAGGAARAAMQVFSDAGVARVSIIARTPEKAEPLLKAFNMAGTVYAFDESSQALNACCLVINASPMGMRGQPLMDDRILKALPIMDQAGLVFDMVYAPLQTDLLQAAAGYGFKTAHGLAMLIGQAATAFTLFYGTPPPRDCDRELMALLTK